MHALHQCDNAGCEGEAKELSKELQLITKAAACSLQTWLAEYEKAVEAFRACFCVGSLVSAASWTLSCMAVSQTLLLLQLKQ